MNFSISGIPVVTLAGSRNEISVNVEKTSDNVYSAVYTPTSPGSYLLNVLWGYKYAYCTIIMAVVCEKPTKKNSPFSFASQAGERLPSEDQRYGRVRRRQSSVHRRWSGYRYGRQRHKEFHRYTESGPGYIQARFSRVIVVVYTQILTNACVFSGELSAHCIGPHKVAYCELYDHGDGTFTLNVKPQESGRHTLTVKYAG